MVEQFEIVVKRPAGAVFDLFVSGAIADGNHSATIERTPIGPMAEGTIEVIQFSMKVPFTFLRITHKVVWMITEVSREESSWSMKVTDAPFGATGVISCTVYDYGYKSVLYVDVDIPRYQYIPKVVRDRLDPSAIGVLIEQILSED